MRRPTWLAALWLLGATWAQRADGPPERFTVAAYAPGSSQVVLFGGFGLNYQGQDEWLSETWTLSQSGTWTFRTPAHCPSARVDHSMATWDDSGVALVGGQEESGAVSSETWLWDGIDWTLDPRGGLPPITRHAATWTLWSANHELLVAHGLQWGQWSTRIWYLKPNRLAWLSQLPATGPEARTYHALAWDGTGVLLTGGVGIPTVKADTWRLSVIYQWEQLASGGPWAAREGHGMAYNEGRGRVVLFGGWAIGGVFPTDAFEWDGMSWTAGAVPGPAGRMFPAMAYDGVRVILYGGTIGYPSYSDDAWRYRIPAPPIGGGPVQ